MCTHFRFDFWSFGWPEVRAVADVLGNKSYKVALSFVQTRCCFYCFYNCHHQIFCLKFLRFHEASGMAVAKYFEAFIIF